MTIWEPPFEERRFPNPPSNLFVPFADSAGRPCYPRRGLLHWRGLRNPQNRFPADTVYPTTISNLTKWN
jgi:hypothetical protein